MPRNPRIWLTRPQEDSATLAHALATHGIESIISPVLRIELIAPFPIRTAATSATDIPPPPQGEELFPQSYCMPNSNDSTEQINYNALLLTSRHAACALASLPAALRALPVFCVGERTGDAARAAGFAHIITGEGTVLALLPRIRQHLPRAAALLYLAGEEVRADMAALLAEDGIAVEKHIVYRSVAEPAPAPALMQAALTGAVFFSPRSAHLAAAHAQQAQLDLSQTDAYCLSVDIAAAAATLPWRRILVTESPTVQAMVHLIVSSLNHPVL